MLRTLRTTDSSKKITVYFVRYATAGGQSCTFSISCKWPPCLRACFDKKNLITSLKLQVPLITLSINNQPRISTHNATRSPWKCPKIATLTPPCAGPTEQKKKKKWISGFLGVLNRLCRFGSKLPTPATWICRF